MGTAKMSRMSDDGNSSDDLIAELARLMADDARGEPAPAAAKPVQERSGRPAPNPVAAPEPASARPAFGAPPSERLNATRSSDALYEHDERPNEDHLGTRVSPKMTPTFRNPTSRANLLREVVSEETPEFAENQRSQPEEDRTSHAAAQAPAPHQKIADDDAFKGMFGDERADARNAAPQFDDSDLEFEEIDFGDTAEPAQQASTPPATPRDPHSGFRAAPEPQDDPEDDPIAELIAAQLHDEPEQRDPHYGRDRAADDENDNFAIPPVFGLGNAAINTEGRTPPKADPLDDIESLISNAVRSGIASNETPRNESLRREPQIADEDVNGAASAAEAAILAATTSMRGGEAAAPQARANVDRFDDSLDDHRADTDEAPEAEWTPKREQRGGLRRLAGPAIAGTLLLALGFGLYWVFGAGPETDVDAPVLSATAEPVKIEPEQPAEAESEAPRSVVFDALDGNTAPGNTEQLVSRDQSGEVATDVASNDVSRIITSEDDGEEAGLANRKVRTVTVRPDGTIVSGEDTLAGAEVLPVERPDVPALPEGTQTAATELATQPILAADAVARLAAESTTAALVNTPVIPVPLPRPVNRPTTPTPGAGSIAAPVNNTFGATSTDANSQAVDLIANLANQTVAAPAATTPAAPSSNAGTLGSAYVQLSSQRSEEAANQSLAAAQRRFGQLLTGGPLEVQRVDLDDRGTFFRVRMPASSLQTANDVCTNIKANGGDCFVRTN